MNIAERIKLLRKQLDISQKKFANKVGISAQYVCEIEKGKKIPRPATMALIERAFGISLSEEHDRDNFKKWMGGEASSIYRVFPGGLGPVLAAVVEIMQSTSEVEKKALVANIEAFLESVRLRNRQGAQEKEMAHSKKAANGEGDT